MQNSPTITTPADRSGRFMENVIRPIAHAVVEELERQRLAVFGSPFLTVAEAAAYMRCKPQRVYDLLALGKIPRCKDGLRVLLHQDDIDAYLKQLKSKAEEKKKGSPRASVGPIRP